MSTTVSHDNAATAATNSADRSAVVLLLLLRRLSLWLWLPLLPSPPPPLLALWCLRQLA
jgi:hypothetical protein